MIVDVELIEALVAIAGRVHAEDCGDRFEPMDMEGMDAGGRKESSCSKPRSGSGCSPSWRRRSVNSLELRVAICNSSRALLAPPGG
jgi:hypothetical protein